MWKCEARSAIKLIGVRAGRPDAAGQRAFHISGPRDEYDRKGRAQLAHGSSQGSNLIAKSLDFRDDGFEPGRRAERSRRLQRSLEAAAIMAAPGVEMADQVRGSDLLQRPGMPPRGFRVVPM